MSLQRATETLANGLADWELHVDELVETSKLDCSLADLRALPQTILACELNGETLLWISVRRSACTRSATRYEMAKCIVRIDAIDGFASIGRGSFWADRGYDRHARI